MKLLSALIKVTWIIEDPDCPYKVTPEDGREGLKAALDVELEEVGGYEYVGDTILDTNQGDTYITVNSEDGTCTTSYGTYDTKGNTWVFQVPDNYVLAVRPKDFHNHNFLYSLLNRDPVAKLVKTPKT